MIPNSPKLCRPCSPGSNGERWTAAAPTTSTRWSSRPTATFAAWWMRKLPMRKTWKKQRRSSSRPFLEFSFSVSRSQSSVEGWEGASLRLYIPHEGTRPTKPSCIEGQGPLLHCLVLSLDCQMPKLQFNGIHFGTSCIHFFFCYISFILETATPNHGPVLLLLLVFKVSYKQPQALVESLVFAKVRLQHQHL